MFSGKANHVPGSPEESVLQRNCILDLSSVSNGFNPIQGPDHRGDYKLLILLFLLYAVQGTIVWARTMVLLSYVAE